jgi:dTDP-4-amino-4,6-dideoxygalactose transaminase
MSDSHQDIGMLPSSMPFFPSEDIDAYLSDVRDILESPGGLRSPRHRDRFERAFADAHGMRHGLAVTSGTMALEAVLRAVGVADAEILVPANTFVASAAVPLSLGANVRFVDIDPHTLSPTVEDVVDALTPQTRFMIIVHMGGIITPELPAIAELCRGREVTLIEDAAHAAGATLGGLHAGRFGRAAAFSMYPTKVITCGEGGMVTTDDDELLRAMSCLREQGRSEDDYLLHDRIGSNYRMSELQAALAWRQVLRIEQIVESRLAIMTTYAAELQGLRHLTPMTWDASVRPSGYKFWLHLDDPRHKSQLQKFAFDLGVELPSGIQDIACHQQPSLAHLADGPLPRAETFCARHVCLPLYPSMTADQTARVIDVVLRYDASR